MKHLIILISLILFTGCSDPMNTKITTSNYKEIVKKINNKSSPEDSLKIKEIIYEDHGNEEIASVLSGKSFNEHIALRNEKIKNLTSLFKFSDYKTEPSSWNKNSLRIETNVENLSGLNIHSFKGYVYIYNKFDNQLIEKIFFESIFKINKDEYMKMTWNDIIDYASFKKHLFLKKDESRKINILTKFSIVDENKVKNEKNKMFDTNDFTYKISVEKVSLFKMVL